MSSSNSMTPQAWWEVTAPPADISNRCRELLDELVPAGVMTTEQLAQVVVAISAQPDLWKPLIVVDPTRRRYRLLFEDDRVDIWVLSWMPGQGTGFHDHDLSGVGLVSVQGMVVERQMLLPSGATNVEMTPGVVRQGGAGYIHSVAHGQGEPAVTIHAYSPNLTRVGQFQVDADGILHRVITHGRQELMDHSIAERDPSRG